VKKQAKPLPAVPKEAETYALRANRRVVRAKRCRSIDQARSGTLKMRMTLWEIHPVHEIEVNLATSGFLSGGAQMNYLEGPSRLAFA
jgi:hypothetical protein